MCTDLIRAWIYWESNGNNHRLSGELLLQSKSIVSDQKHPVRLHRLMLFVNIATNPGGLPEPGHSCPPTRARHCFRGLQRIARPTSASELVFKLVEITVKSERWEMRPPFHAVLPLLGEVVFDARRGPPIVVVVARPPRLRAVPPRWRRAFIPERSGMQPAKAWRGLLCVRK